jgi:hypothetical protein
MILDIATGIYQRQKFPKSAIRHPGASLSPPQKGMDIEAPSRLAWR